MSTFVRPPVAVVVQQHQEETACLRATREVLAGAPHVRLHQLRRIDDRIAAHLDGLAVAGAYGSRLCEAALASPGLGEVFTATVRAILERNAEWLARLLSLAEVEDAAERGLLAAFGWVSAVDLRGITRELLASRSTYQRHVGLRVCAMHQVDPGPTLRAALADEQVGLLRSALSVAGTVGRQDLLQACLKALDHDDESTRFEAARAALLLGDRAAALATLSHFVNSPGRHRREAIGLHFAAAPVAHTRAALKVLAQRQAEPAELRALIVATGCAGDAHFVPWLIQQMADRRTARLAGESFALLTGLDLAYIDLELKPPEGVVLGPNDDPEDADVALEEDDSLPWPDPQKIAAWWRDHGSKFTPGTRHFMGESNSAANALQVLSSGFQRQRAAAARELRVQAPGRPLFATSAPAWRQQRLLAAGVS